MSLGSRLRRLRGSFRNNAFEESMEAELRHHLELEAEMLAARGMSTGSNPETIANRNARMLAAIGRLRPGATLQQVQGDLDAVSHRLVAADPAEYDPPRTGFRTAALMVRDELTRRARPTLLMLLAATGFVLLLVAANVANLTLARVLGRERELAVRAALGAGPRRIARQLLTESTILAVAGGGLGLIVAWLVRDLLVAFTVRFTPRAEEIAIGAAVFAFALAVSVGTGLATGVYAASGFPPPLPTKSRESGGAKADTTSMRSALIAVQVAVAFVLLAGAGLLARSAIALQDVDAGFHADRVLTMRIDLDFGKYDTQASRRDFFRAVLERVQAEPGVRTAALSFDVPLDITHTMRRELLVEGDSSPPRRAPADLKFTSPAYFETIGMSRLSGRLFTAADTAETPRVAVVNLALAQHYFADADPIGRRVSLDDGTTWITIVGVVNDVRQQRSRAERERRVVPAVRAHRRAERDAARRHAARSGRVRAADSGGRPPDRSAPGGQPRADAAGDSRPIARAAAADGDAGRALRGGRARPHRDRHRRGRLVFGDAADG